MDVFRRLAAPVAVLAALAFAAPALAQSPGDDQYSDPFGSGQSGGGGGSSNATPTPTPAASSAPSTPAAPSSSTTPSAASAAATPVPVASSAAPVTTSSGQLPYTGADAGLLALAGALCIAGGVALRVRLRDQQ
ncbi:MAG TPA: LPXTG cell wall anchor domain-containing protein [Solirubrobacteraceae bacterium]|nr:LPXTG cell wall anchor domain-containing protein [Solirubrobacteraceae bacterium]